MKLAKYLKTQCPHCGSEKHKNDGTHKRGYVIIRYHICRWCKKRFRSEAVVK